MSNASYKDCSKCPPFAWTWARSRKRHWLIVVSSTTLCSRLSTPTTRQSNAVSDRRRLALSPNKRGPASYPTPCSQQGWSQGCWEVTDWQQWKTKPLAGVTGPSLEPYRPVGALSCWKMDRSPEIVRISDSISGFNSTSRTYSPLILMPSPRIWGG